MVLLLITLGKDVLEEIAGQNKNEAILSEICCPECDLKYNCRECQLWEHSMLKILIEANYE